MEITQEEAIGYLYGQIGDFVIQIRAKDKTIHDLQEKVKFMKQIIDEKEKAAKPE